MAWRGKDCKQWSASRAVHSSGDSRYAVRLATALRCWARRTGVGQGSVSLGMGCKQPEADSKSRLLDGDSHHVVWCGTAESGRALLGQARAENGRKG